MKIFQLLFLSLLLFGSCNIFESKKDHPDEVKDKKGSTSSNTATSDDRDLNNTPEMPARFLGGAENMMRYLQKNIKYPSFCSENSIEGKVYIEFVIDADGYVTNAKIKRSVHPDLDNEALRVVRGMPKWTPATDFNGNSVRSRYVLPVNFKLA